MKVILIILIYILITLIVNKIYFKQYDYFTTKYGFECATCPANSTSPPGSMSQTDCLCNIGYSGPDGGSCTPCPTGTFKEYKGVGTCATCPPNKYQDNTGSQTCKPCVSLCEAGKYLDGCGVDNSGSCALCPPNKYQPSTGQFECNVCPINSTSPSGSDSIDDCLCNAGYERYGDYCIACQSGFYKTDAGNSSSCLPCEAGTFKANSGAGTCNPCEDNKYQDESGQFECKHCPSNSTSPLGSDSIDNCECNAGYERDGSNCNKCQKGKYKTDAGNNTCLPCEAGTFNANRGMGICQQCPDNMTSPIGSDSVDDCECDVGYSSPDGGPCTACQAGFYKDSTGSSSCLPCKEGKYQDDPGSQTCKPCDDSLCGADQYIVGCGGGNAGECIDNWGVTSCGWNNKGQLGINSTEFERKLIKVRIQNNMFNNIKIIKISAGYRHSLFLTKEGQVYSCGWNSNGQLGFDSGRKQDDQDITDGREWDWNYYPYHIRPVLIQKYYNSDSEAINYDRITIDKISAGSYHSLFLTREGRVYSCGENRYGQLGLNSTDLQKKTPRLISGFSNVTKASAGHDHSLFLTSDGHVYSCGWNSLGNLGLGNTDKQLTPTLIERYYDSDYISHTYDRITITKISAGDSHSLFLTRDGQVYSCGLNNDGQLGLGTSGNGNKELSPKLITTYYGNNGVTTNYETIEIDKISTSHYHSLFLTRDGQVYSCGQNDWGQLGLGTSGSGSEKSSPTLIETYSTDSESDNYSSIVITKISAGHYHNLFLTSNNQVFSCGYNDWGQLGLNSNEDKIKTPRLIQITSDTEISEISCRGNHSLFLESYGDWDACPDNTIRMGGQCIPCLDGEQPNGSKTGCEVCPQGTAGMGGECNECPDGQQQNSSKTECEVCPDRHAGINGQCQVCGPGTEPNEYKTECISCPSGTWGVGGACSVCVGCPEGEERIGCSENSEGSCVDCPSGKYKKDFGTDRCITAHAKAIINTERTDFTCESGWQKISNPSTCACLWCDPGHGRKGGSCNLDPFDTDLGSCLVCTGNTYNAGYNNDTCTPVPIHSYPTQQNDDFICNSGFSKNAWGTACISDSPDALTVTVPEDALEDIIDSITPACVIM